MFKKVLLIMSLLLLAFSVSCFAGEAAKSPRSQTETLISPHQPPAVKKALVVIYTLSTCPHCKEAREYLTKNDIPFIDHEVDLDEEQMTALMKIYDSMGVPDQKRGVPLFVIDNKVRIQGFNKAKLQAALKEVGSTSK
ncbi:MAG: glutaredoxin domain-containing protein [Desulfuromonadaceae bacterium]|nr:glutaredoxin domain-containing protein [Desulfuromonadaceae bacterium]